MLWHCPNGCAAVRGPDKPRKENICRYCMPCSSKAGKIVARLNPSLEKKRQERRKKANEKAQDKAARKRAHRVQTDVLDHFRCGETAVRILNRIRSKVRVYEPIPVVEVRKSQKRRNPRFDARGIIFYDFPGCDQHDATAMVTVAVARRSVPHEEPINGLKVRIRWYTENALGVRPRLNRLVDADLEVADLLRAKHTVAKLAAGA